MGTEVLEWSLFVVLSKGNGKAWAAEGAVKVLVREMSSCPNPHGKRVVWDIEKPQTQQTMVVHSCGGARGGRINPSINPLYFSGDNKGF